jgi:hypothetical protein
LAVIGQNSSPKVRLFQIPSRARTTPRPPANRIRKERPTTKIAPHVWALGPTDIERLAGGNNPYRIMWKPFKAELLLRMVENALGSSAAAAGA